MNSIAETILRSGLGFVLLLAFTRIIGNKQLGQLNIFTYISGIAVGAMAGGMAILHDIEVVESVIGIVVWGVLTIAFEKSTLTSARLRQFFTGDPIIIIKNGVVQRAAMKKERLSLDDLMMLLRTNHIFSLSEVHYAIMEANGELSVLKKKESDAPTLSDLNIAASDPPHLPSIVISDGRIVDQALRELGKDTAWLEQAMKEHGVNHASQVFVAEVMPDGTLALQMRTSS